ncbi:MAG: hypothetical protein ACYC96_07485 [Fimbriimonadaceae bacterium]
MQPIVSETYIIGRLELAYATAGLYVRTLWWALIGVPISGVLILFLLPLPIMRYLGAVMVLWPITIPGRALVITSDQRKLYSRPTVATFRDDAFYLDPEGGTPTRIPLSWMRRAQRRGTMWLLVGEKGKLVLIKAAAFSAEAQAMIQAALDAHGPLR